MTLESTTSTTNDPPYQGKAKLETPYWRRRLPPVDTIALASLVLVVIDGVYMVSYLPHQAPITPVIALLGASGACLIAACLALTRIRGFAWDKFFLVLRWVVVEYAVEAGMLEYIFTYDNVRGRLLIIVTLALIIFATDIPVIMAFTVARYQELAA